MGINVKAKHKENFNQHRKQGLKRKKYVQILKNFIERLINKKKEQNK